MRLYCYRRIVRASFGKNAGKVMLACYGRLGPFGTSKARISSKSYVRDQGF